MTSNTPPTYAIEWPTVALLMVMYAAFGLLTWNAADLSWYILLPAGAYLVCLHGSLQHEILHGHPTPWNTVNEIFIFPALSLWLPYRRYRTLHERHHRTPYLTDPYEDPESFYLSQTNWQQISRPMRLLLTFHNTIAGRLLLGPALAAIFYWREEIRELAQGNYSILKDWLLHLAGVFLLLYWVLVVVEMSLWQYILLFAYPGTALTLLRSFAEHQAHEDVHLKTAILHASPVMSLLYLNNNLHAVHHKEPRVAWYRLPQHHKQAMSGYLAHGNNYTINGYGELLGRYLFRPKEKVRHPIVK